MAAPNPVDPQRAEALDAALHSATLSRSEQLRSFLRYVGELEIAGRSSEITEYLIGVQALNRPEKFSPSVDSTVRTRAHLLRQKLAELYETELRESTVRIELPRGSYVPRFVTVEPQAEAPPTAAPRASPWWRIWVIAGCCVVAGIVGTLMVTRLASGPTHHLEPVLAEAWGPLVQHNASVLLCVSNPVHLAVRPIGEAQPPSWVIPFAAPEDLKSRYARMQPYWKHNELFLEFTENSIRLGDAFALAHASGVLSGAGAQTEVLLTRSVHSPVFRGRNMILIGTPDFSGVARGLLDRAAFTIAWDDRNRDLAIIETPGPTGATRTFLPVRSASSKGTVEVSYGLVTVLPSEGSAGGRHRTVVISGATSAGAHGAMEYFASAPSMSDLLGKLRNEGHTQFPAAYQVVVRCPAANDVLESFHYAGHRVLDASALRR